MAIGGAFLGGGVEVVPAGSCKLELEILTEDRANLTATFTIKGTSTYTVTAGADGRAVYTVPAGQTYTVSVNTTGYDNIASQTVIAESGTVRYVRFEAFAGRVKRSGDTMTGTLAVVGGASIDTNGQVVGKKLRATADNHLGNSPSSYAVINDGWIQNRTLEETKADLGVTDKQDKLTAGTNITIDGTTISAKDTTYDVATQSANGLMSSTDKTKLDGVDSALAGKVSKTGDTMDGNLTIQNDSVRELTLKNTSISKSYERYKQVGIINGNASDGTIGKIEFLRNTPFGFLASGVIISAYNSTGTQQALSIYSFDDGVNQEAYVQHPSWKVGTNDNSDKSLTIKMANSLPSLVHTTGNENIAGVKTFSREIIRLHGSANAGAIPTSNQYIPLLFAKGNDNLDFGWIRLFAQQNTKRRVMQIQVNRVNDDGTVSENAYLQLFADDGTKGAYATAPTTPSGATGTEIVTADWSLGKFQRKITYGTGDPPSGGQAGDIYIKI